jgi:hypothetical protein
MHFLKRLASGATCVGLLIAPLTACRANENQAKKHSFSSISASSSRASSDGLGLGPFTSLELAKRDYVAKVLWYTTIAKNQESERIGYNQVVLDQQHNAKTSNAFAVSGSCARMKPPGFPDYIIERESQGNPNIYNSEGSGAYGCVQLMPMNRKTGDYATDWANLWDNGRGACHWDPPNYCGG